MLGLQIDKKTAKKIKYFFHVLCALNLVASVLLVVSSADMFLSAMSLEQDLRLILDINDQHGLQQPQALAPRVQNGGHVRQRREILEGTKAGLMDVMIKNLIRIEVAKEMEKVRMAASQLPVIHGSTYIRWGKSTCPKTSYTIYSGIAGGTKYNAIGGSSSYVCLPDDPEYSDKSGSRNPSVISAVEYQSTGNVIPQEYADAPCSVCQAKGRSTQLMLPAKLRCPDQTWTLEYTGYLMSASTQWHHHYRTEFVCVDKDAQGRQDSSGSNGGAYWYTTTVDCGRLNYCGPYKAGKEITCVVCTQ